jgi:hypothetical protein
VNEWVVEVLQKTFRGRILSQTGIRAARDLEERLARGDQSEDIQ